MQVYADKIDEYGIYFKANIMYINENNFSVTLQYALFINIIEFVLYLLNNEELINKNIVIGIEEKINLLIVTLLIPLNKTIDEKYLEMLEGNRYLIKNVNQIVLYDVNKISFIVGKKEHV